MSTERINQMKTTKEVGETFKSSITTQINSNRKHGWGQKDSMAVIEDMLAEFGGCFASAEENDIALAKAVMERINKLVNPSACRQWLESKEINLLDKSLGRDGKAKATFDEFAA